MLVVVRPPLLNDDEIWTKQVRMRKADEDAFSRRLSSSVSYF